MMEFIAGTTLFLAKLAVGVLVIAGFVCWWWFISGLLYYREHKDLPEYHVYAEAHKDLTWWNGWRWSVSDTFRPLKDNVMIETLVFGVAAASALIWVLGLIFK